jgi:hypothetical protein
MFPNQIFPSQIFAPSDFPRAPAGGINDQLTFVDNVTVEGQRVLIYYVIDTLTLTDNFTNNKKVSASDGSGTGSSSTGIHDTLNFADTLTNSSVGQYSAELAQTLHFSSNVTQSLGLSLISFHDQLHFIDSPTQGFPPTFPGIANDTLVLTDSLSTGGNTHNITLSDRLIFAVNYYQKYVEGILLNIPILIATKIPGGKGVSGGSSSAGSYFDPNLNYNPTLPFVIIQSTTTTIALPAPMFGDTQTNIGSVIINRAVDGTIYTIVKKTSRNRLKWKFEVKRQKSNEMQLFLQNNTLQYLTITDWKGNTWYMLITNNPVIFEAVSKDGSCTLNNERHQFELELEGYLISSQATTC